MKEEHTVYIMEQSSDISDLVISICGHLIVLPCIVCDGSEPKSSTVLAALLEPGVA